MTAPWPEYEELYTQHFDELVARARSLVDDPDEAEDLVHDAFLILLERVERGGGAPARALTDPRAFLFGCLRRLARNLRERGRRRSDLLNRRETPTLTPAQTDGIEARLLCEWVFARLHPAEAELLRSKIAWVLVHEVLHHMGFSHSKEMDDQTKECLV